MNQQHQDNQIEEVKEEAKEESWATFNFDNNDEDKGGRGGKKHQVDCDLDDDAADGGADDAVVSSIYDKLKKKSELSPGKCRTLPRTFQCRAKRMRDSLYRVHA